METFHHFWRPPEKFMRADWRDPVLQKLDNALNPKLRGTFGHLADQAKRWPFLRVVPAAEVRRNWRRWRGLEGRRRSRRGVDGVAPLCACCALRWRAP